MSDLTINNIKGKTVGDKVISGGERSLLTIKGLDFSHFKVGIASKDVSAVQGSNIQLNHGKVGFSAFQKKSEFGPGAINVNQVILKNIQNETLLEKGSQIKIDGNIIGEEKLNVAEEISE